MKLHELGPKAWVEDHRRETGLVHIFSLQTQVSNRGAEWEHVAMVLLTAHEFDELKRLDERSGSKP